MKLSRIASLFTILGALIVGLIIIPVITIFFRQFAFDFNGFLNSLTSVSILSAVGRSCFAAFLAVIITLVFGVPLAYLLARKDFRGKNLIEGIIDLPMAIPHVVAGIALLTVFGVNGLIGGPVSSLIKFEGALPGIVVAMTFVSAPFLINSAREGFKSVNPHLEKVARSLGASEWVAFRKVTLPLAFPHILSGAVMSWARAISEFAAVIMLVGYFPMIAPGLIWSKFYSSGLEEGMSIAIVLLIITLTVFTILKYVRRNYVDQY